MDLILNAKQGDTDSLSELYQSNIGLARKMIFKYFHDEQDRDDILQECYFVMLKCLRSFDPSFGVQFSTYYSSAVKRMVGMYLKKQRNTLSELTLNGPASDDADSTAELVDIIPDPKSEFVDDLDWTFLQTQVQKILSIALTDTEKYITFGNKGKGIPLSELGKGIGLTRNQAYAIYIRCFLKLRKNTELKRLAKDCGIIKYKTFSMDIYSDVNESKTAVGMDNSGDITRSKMIISLDSIRDMNKSKTQTGVVSLRNATKYKSAINTCPLRAAAIGHIKLHINGILRSNYGDVKNIKLNSGICIGLISGYYAAGLIDYYEDYKMLRDKVREAESKMLIGTCDLSNYDVLDKCV